MPPDFRGKVMIAQEGLIMNFERSLIVDLLNTYLEYLLYILS